MLRLQRSCSAVRGRQECGQVQQGAVAGGGGRAAQGVPEQCVVTGQGVHPPQVGEQRRAVRGAPGRAALAGRPGGCGARPGREPTEDPRRVPAGHRGQPFGRRGDPVVGGAAGQRGEFGGEHARPRWVHRMHPVHRVRSGGRSVATCRVRRAWDHFVRRPPAGTGGDSSAGPAAAARPGDSQPTRVGVPVAARRVAVPDPASARRNRETSGAGCGAGWRGSASPPERRVAAHYFRPRTTWRKP